MPKYIDADKLVNDLRKYHRSRKNYGKSYETISREIYSIISKQSYANVEPVRHGRWIPINRSNPVWSQFGIKQHKCSECGCEEESARKRCPECGAHMNAEPPKEEDDEQIG